MGILFKIDTTEETNKCATALAGRFGLASDHILKFNDKSAIKTSKFAEVVCLGHTNPGLGAQRTYGAYTPKKFVDRFEDLFLASLKKGSSEKNIKKAKKEVKDLYLIGCEVGLTIHGTCFAQEVADLLEARGFEKAKVHAVKSPEAAQAMTVEVETNLYAGSLKVTYGTAQELATIEKLREEIKNGIEPSKNNLSQKESAPKDLEWVKKNRAEREKNNTAATQKRDELGRLEKDHTSLILDIKKGCDLFRGPHAAAKHPEKVAKTSKQKVVEEDKQAPVSSSKDNAKKESYFKSSGENAEGEAFLKESPKSSAVLQPTYEPATKSVRKDDDCEGIRKAVKQYVDLLVQEAAARSCISFFGHLGKYKLSKFQELQGKIQRLTSVKDIKDEVEKLRNSSAFITRGSTQRAENLIANILADDYKNGIEAPKQSLQ